MTTDNDFTHILASMPSTSGIYLSGMAKGALLLHPGYICKSDEKERFIDETEYEFGNEAFDNNVLSQEIDERLAKAGYRWRNWIKNNPDQFSNGAFSDCNFIMMNLPPDRIEQLASVVICGGGEMNKIDMTTATVAEIKSC